MSWHAYGTLPGLEFQTEIRFDGTNWVDVSTDLRFFSTNVSRSRALGLFPVGTGKFTFKNQTGTYSPINSSSTYAGNLLPGRHLRHRERYGGVIYNVWYGIIDDWGDELPQAKIGWATVSTRQPTVVLAGGTNPPAAALVGDSEAMGARLSRWLTFAGWTLPTSIATGYVPLQGTDLSDDAASGIAKAVRTELGAAWCDLDGTFVAEDRYALVTNSRSKVSQATFGPGATEIGYTSDPALSSGLDLVMNSYTAGNVGQTPTTITNPSSIASLQATFPGSDTALIGTDANWAAGNAEAMVRLYGTPQPYPTAVTVAPWSSSNDPTVAYPGCLARRLRDLVTVKTPTPWGTTYSTDCWVVGRSDSGEPSRGREITFEFEPAANYAGITLFTLDTSSLDGSHILGW